MKLYKIWGEGNNILIKLTWKSLIVRRSLMIFKLKLKKFLRKKIEVEWLNWKYDQE